MLERSLQYLKRQPTWRILLIACIALAVLAGLDWFSGDLRARVGIFYLFPIALVTLYVGRLSGFVMAFLCAEIWFFAELRAEKVDPMATYMTGLIRLAFFLLAVIMLATWREIGQGVERLVEERTRALRTEIADRKQAETSLHTLAMQLAEAEDAQRRRLAQDLHDAIGQTLSMVKFRLESAASTAYTTEHHNALEVCLKLVDKIIAQTRTMTFDLHPPMLDDLGLVPALRWYAKEFKRQTGAEMSVREQGEAGKPPASINTYLFRAIKELSNNSLKHGRATEVCIGVHWNESTVRAVIDDNGSGFDPTCKSQAAGLGLAGIRERATTLGGQLQLESAPGKGCRAILQLPLVV